VRLHRWIAARPPTAERRGTAAQVRRSCNTRTGSEKLPPVHRSAAHRQLLPFDGAPRSAVGALVASIFRTRRFDAVSETSPVDSATCALRRSLHLRVDRGVAVQQPHFPNTLYSAVDRKPKRSRWLRRIENARARPAVTILVDSYNEDWGRLWWVRLRDRARVLDAGEERACALGLLCEKYRQCRTAPPDGPHARRRHNPRYATGRAPLPRRTRDHLSTASAAQRLLESPPGPRRWDSNLLP
jgi:PPOX class probable F420-dependent enzyme